MPKYDYRCPVCGSIVEDFGNYNDDIKIKQCFSLQCKGEQQIFKRIISSKPPAVILKGNCWASDGYSRQDNKKK
jgi:predicted nucleic acid-binding Zn ribbon protein